MSKNYFHAIATIMGTMIGVGMFSIPFVIHKAGIILFFAYMLVLGLIQYYMHMIYAEICLATKKRHRVPGYVVEYFGKRYKKPILIIVLISVNLSMLSYLIIGGIFLKEIFSPAFGGGAFFYSTLMLAITALLTYKGLKFIAKVELLMSFLLFFVIILIFINGFPHIDFSNYTPISWGSFFLPYGPVLMALGGMTAIPTITAMLNHKKENISSVIFWGIFLSIILTTLFVLTVVGVSGANTSPDSLAGLHGTLGSGIVLIALVFGLISILTSFIMFIEATKEIYWLDLGVKKKNAWSLALIIPFVLFLLGIDNLTSVVSLSGAVIGGIISIIYIILILKVKQKKQRQTVINVFINNKIAAFLTFVFMLGLVTVLDYVGLREILIISSVLFFYLFALIESDKHDTTIYFEFFQLSKKVGLFFAFVFLIILTFGVFRVLI